jgi:serine/threonine-protein kinase
MRSRDGKYKKYYPVYWSKSMLNGQTNHPIFGKLVGGRYYILEILSFGVLGRTYLAKDIRQTGSPKCVIKHVKAVSDEPKTLETLKRLFLGEAEILINLGKHEQIPQVLATFENDQGFYLVQEFIEGQPLSELLPTSTRCGQRWTEFQVVKFLKDLLGILEFIHAHRSIHCNINPSNIIKCVVDGKLFLTDFGAVQQVQNTAPDVKLNLNPSGYIPGEQLAFQPRINSDIYALGTIGVQALTGLRPAQLQIDENITWQRLVSDELAGILTRMVQPDYKDRYQNATEVLQALHSLPVNLEKPIEVKQISSLQPTLNLVQTPEPKELILPSFAPTEFTDDLPISLWPIPLPPLEFDPDIEIHIPGIPPVLIMLSLSLGALVANYVFIEAGIHDILEPDPKELKLVKPNIKEEELLSWSEELCRIPYLCFFQGLPLSEREVYLLRKKAYAHAYKGDFTSALKYLEQITPSSPQYDCVKIKIAEYRKKQELKNSQMGTTANSNTTQ